MDFDGEVDRGTKVGGGLVGEIRRRASWPDI